MTNRYVIVNMDNKLQVFNADTERDQLLARVMHYNKNDKTRLGTDSKVLLSKLAEGLLDEAFPEHKDRLVHRSIGEVTLYYGTHGIEPVKVIKK